MPRTKNQAVTGQSVYEWDGLLYVQHDHRTRQGHWRGVLSEVRELAGGLTMRSFAESRKRGKV